MASYPKSSSGDLSKTGESMEDGARPVGFPLSSTLPFPHMHFQAGTGISVPPPYPYSTAPPAYDGGFGAPQNAFQNYWRPTHNPPLMLEQQQFMQFYGMPPGQYFTRWEGPGSRRKCKITVEYVTDEESGEPVNNPKGNKSKKETKGISDDRKSRETLFNKPKPPGKHSKLGLDVVKGVAELKALGKYELLSLSDPAYKTIQRFVENSCDLQSPNGSIKVHEIAEFNKGNGQAYFLQGPKRTVQLSKTLLWFKTTTASVRHLINKDDACIAFYDRAGRAFAANPNDLDEPLRQTLILCSVALGKQKGHRLGHKFWANRDFPEGYDSIKALGRLCPYWKDSREDKDKITLIPCGKTVEHGKFQSYEQEYNEYLIKEVRRALVRYAVDIEIIPGNKAND